MNDKIGILITSVNFVCLSWIIIGIIFDYILLSFIGGVIMLGGGIFVIIDLHLQSKTNRKSYDESVRDYRKMQKQLDNASQKFGDGIRN